VVETELVGAGGAAWWASEAWLTTPVPSAVTMSFRREMYVFTWKVLRFWDVLDLDNQDHPRPRGTSRLVA